MSKPSKPSCGKPLENDPVSRPSHYTQGPVECIEAIESALGKEGFEAFLTGQVIKYLWRQKGKNNQLQDLQKASWYLDLLIESADHPESRSY